jgi:hypothetical protein
LKQTKKSKAMDSNTHTPGPWWNPEHSNEVMTIPRGDIKICKVHAISEDNNGQANAKLIAAAPELLEACIAIRDGWGKNLSEPMKMINTAIQKAQGK